MNESSILIRLAVRSDAAAILHLIEILADYEHSRDQVTNTAAQIQKVIFDEHHAEVLLAELDGRVIGMAVFFHNYSTWNGHAGIWLEDFVVEPQFKGRGYGHLLLQALAKLAQERDCERLEWSCLDWNEPSRQFYFHLGAKAMTEWTTFRLDKAGIATLAGGGL